jgi:hypothetical protein
MNPATDYEEDHKGGTASLDSRAASRAHIIPQSVSYGRNKQKGSQPELRNQHEIFDHNLELMQKKATQEKRRLVQ